MDKKKSTKDTKELDIKYIEKSIETKFNQLLVELPELLKKTNKKDSSEIFELTLIEIYQNTIQTIIDIINDLLFLMDNNLSYDTIYRNLLNIFFNENRMFYIGIIFVILSFVIYFIDGATI